MKCQCPDDGILKAEIAFMYNPVTERPFVNHEPGKCKCSNEIKQYKRGKKKLWLCSCCHLSGDELI